MYNPSLLQKIKALVCRSLGEKAGLINMLSQIKKYGLVWKTESRQNPVTAALV